MRKISLLLNKPAISSTNGEFLGTVTGVLCEKSLKSVEYLNILKESDMLSDYVFVAPRSVKSISDESVVLTNSLCIKNAAEIKTDAVEFPFGGKIYNSIGEVIGTVTDLYIGDTTKQVLAIVTEEGEEILPDRVSSVSYGIVTILPENMSKKRRGAPKKMPKSAEDLPVSLFEKEENNVSEEVSVPEKDLSEDKTEFASEVFTPKIEELPLSQVVATQKTSIMPARVIGNYRFLLGRIVVNNIYDKRNVLIVKKNTLITADVVLAAHKHNKLVELTLNSRL